MSFNISLSGHIHGDVEAAKAFEEKIVTDLRAWVTEVESYGHSIAGSFIGQHIGGVTLQTPVDQGLTAGTEAAPAPTEEGDAPPAGKSP